MQNKTAKIYQENSTHHNSKPRHQYIISFPQLDPQFHSQQNLLLPICFCKIPKLSMKLIVVYIIPINHKIPNL